MSLKRWLYRGGRPNAIAKILNKGWAFLHSSGISPNYLVTLLLEEIESAAVVTAS